nr:MAG TPA: hypothetical protein [Caudoviricetes sp.]
MMSKETDYKTSARIPSILKEIDDFFMFKLVVFCTINERMTSLAT